MAPRESILPSGASIEPRAGVVQAWHWIPLPPGELHCGWARPESFVGARDGRTRKLFGVRACWAGSGGCEKATEIVQAMFRRECDCNEVQNEQSLDSQQEKSMQLVMVNPNPPYCYDSSR